MSTLQATNIKNASSATTNLALDTAGNATVGNALIMGSGSFLRNRIINGDMRIWQRGTSFTLSSGSYVYTADRFFARYASVGTATQSTDVPSTAGSAFLYSLKCQRNSGQTSTSGNYLVQIIESINCYDLSNQTITISFWAKKGADYSGASNTILVNVQTGTAADQGQSGWWANFTGYNNVINTSITLTSSWQKYTLTGNCGAGVLEAAFTLYYAGQGTAGADDSFYITGVQLEAGSTATPFERRQYGQELALCQRYFQFGSIRAEYNSGGTGTFSTPASVFPVPMRAAPTITAISTNGAGNNFLSYYPINRNGIYYGYAANISMTVNGYIYRYTDDKLDAEL